MGKKPCVIGYHFVTFLGSAEHLMNLYWIGYILMKLYWISWWEELGCLFILHRASRNPYDASRIAGGSSSGSAAVVSAGLCPVALGVDGGGIFYILVDEKDKLITYHSLLLISISHIYFFLFNFDTVLYCQ
jgi:hypothetical protein